MEVWGLVTGCSACMRIQPAPWRTPLPLPQLVGLLSQRDCRRPGETVQVGHALSTPLQNTPGWCVRLLGGRCSVTSAVVGQGGAKVGQGEICSGPRWLTAAALAPLQLPSCTTPACRM